LYVSIRMRIRLTNGSILMRARFPRKLKRKAFFILRRFQFRRKVMLVMLGMQLMKDFIIMVRGKIIGVFDFKVGFGNNLRFKVYVLSIQEML
jgi:hypothetical protein